MMPLPLMILKPSFYNHYTSLDGNRQTVLFNKFWGSVAVVDRKCADAVAEADLAAIPLSQIDTLEAGGFLVAADLDERAAARERYQLRKGKNSLLGITIELTQECNLTCTFCYQNSYRSTEEITDLAIERVEQYIATVVTDARRPIQEIALRFIGGEPLMQKKKILVAIKKIRSTSENLGVTLNTQVDTNGLLLDEAIVRVMDATSITITNKADHDKVRVRHIWCWQLRPDSAANPPTRSALQRVPDGLGSVVQRQYLQREVYFRHVPHGQVSRYPVHAVRRVHTVNYDYNLLIPTLTGEQFKRLYLDVSSTAKL